MPVPQASSAARHASTRKRCHWVPLADPEYVRYHDAEWGRPVHDDRRLFEMLILEGAQAGLSWSTVLHKRAGYRRAFANFVPRTVARIDARRLGDADEDDAAGRGKRIVGDERHTRHYAAQHARRRSRNLHADEQRRVGVLLA